MMVLKPNFPSIEYLYQNLRVFRNSTAEYRGFAGQTVLRSVAPVVAKINLMRGSSWQPVPRIRFQTHPAARMDEILPQGNRLVGAHAGSSE